MGSTVKLNLRFESVAEGSSFSQKRVFKDTLLFLIYIVVPSIIKFYGCKIAHSDRQTSVAMSWTPLQNGLQMAVLLNSALFKNIGADIGHWFRTLVFPVVMTKQRFVKHHGSPNSTAPYSLNPFDTMCPSSAQNNV